MWLVYHLAQLSNILTKQLRQNNLKEGLPKSKIFQIPCCEMLHQYNSLQKTFVLNVRWLHQSYVCVLLFVSLSVRLSDGRSVGLGLLWSYTYGNIHIIFREKWKTKSQKKSKRNYIISRLLLTNFLRMLDVEDNYKCLHRLLPWFVGLLNTISPTSDKIINMYLVNVALHIWFVLNHG